MPIATALHPLFAARVDGIDINHSFDATRVKDALDRWSVLVFPRQTISNRSQITLGEIFGPLETTRADANELAAS